ncbi:MAG: tetratricopeptide repeat protein [Treponema sp.]|nr:tetratricopeptide repeat protein [Candidatus Treponema equi]
MKKINVAAFLAGLGLIVCSCASGKGIVVPGESEVIERNIIEEYYSIAEVYKSQKNYTKAIEYYTKVLDDKDLHDSAFYQIALCNVYNKNWEVARKSFVKLLKKDPENLTLKMSLAYIESMRGNLKTAEKMYSYICSEDADNPELMVNYVNVLIAREKYQSAKEKLAELEEKFPDNESIGSLKKKISEFLEDETEKKDASEGEEEPVDGDTLFGLSEEEKTEEPAVEDKKE